MMLGKRGSENWYLIISLILGVIILIIVVYWIFQEYFNENDTGRELCRQSIILRDNAPEGSILLADFSLKDSFPLKCKTENITIDYQKTERAEKEIADALAECWYLVGEGKFKFISHDSGDVQTGCFVCARIHIKDDKKIKEFYQEDKNRINLRDTLYLKMNNGKTYYEYLNKGEISAIPFKAISSAGTVWSDKNEFEVRSGGHSVSFSELAGASAYFGIIGAVFDLISQKSNAKEKEEGGPGFLFPWKFDPGRGDLYIVISAAARKGEKLSPFLLFLQGDDLTQLDKPLATFGSNMQLKPCNKILTIPA